MSAVFFARFDENGRYTMSGTVPDDSPTLTEPDVYVGRVDLLSQYHDTTTGTPVDMPPRPSAEHHFDFATKIWTGNIEALRAKKHKTIEDVRDLRLNEPTIEYDGVVVDADAQAKQNLQDKITATSGRISRKVATPQQMLVWKDHANVIHAFADLDTYKAWLDGFAVALENRGMQAWAWSWQAKDQLNALATFDDVMAFDPVPPWAAPPAPAPAPTDAPASAPTNGSAKAPVLSTVTSLTGPVR